MSVSFALKGIAIVEKVRINSFLEYQYVSQPEFSPDGQMAAFVVETASLEENSYHGDLYLLNPVDGSHRRLTSAGDVFTYLWTQEGKVLFPALRDKNLRRRIEAGEEMSCWYELDPRGGEAELAFTIPLKVSELRQVDDDRFVAAAYWNHRSPDLDTLSQDDRRDALEKLKNPSYEILEESPFWADGAGFTDGIRMRLYLFTRSTGALRPLTPPWLSVKDFSVLGTKLIYCGVQWQKFLKRDDYPGVALVDIATDESRVLVEQGQLFISNVGLWDEEWAVAIGCDPERSLGKTSKDFFLLNLNTCEIKDLGGCDRQVIYRSLLSDAAVERGHCMRIADGKCYFLMTDNCWNFLCAMDKEGTRQLRLTGEGNLLGFDVLGSNTLVCAMMDGKLAELYLNGRQVTFFNEDWIKRHTVVRPEPHQFTDGEGYRIDGWAMRPADYVEGRRYPAILVIHGGPRLVYSDIYFHEMQVWANSGYFVLFCNPRGSDGKGDAFADIYGRMGSVDYENLMAFTDEMLKKYPEIDPDRLGVTGGSYGGFMTNWVIGHTDRFAAAASLRSLSTATVFEHTSDIGNSFGYEYFQTETRENAEKMWALSPLKYADHCTTPTLFINADRDYRCWMAEGLMMFTALKLHGCEAAMCLIKGENHDLTFNGTPRNRILSMKEILCWMDRHLKRGGTGCEED